MTVDRVVTGVSALPLPAGTVAHPGHGDDPTIGEEAPHRDEWVARGH